MFYWFIMLAKLIGATAAHEIYDIGYDNGKIA